MDWIILILVALIGGILFRSLRSLKGRVERVERELRILCDRLKTANGEEVARRKLDRELLWQVSQGVRFGRDQLLAGQLFGELSGAEAAGLFERGQTVIVDVREDHEWEAGHIPGSIHIPINHLPQRWEEIPHQGKSVLLVCAMGSRSAAGCHFLSSEKGLPGVFNLATGVGSWPGKLVRGDTVNPT